MEFVSFPYAGFLAAALVVHTLVGSRWKNVALLIASLVFIGSADVRFVGVFLLGTVVEYAIGRKLAADDSDEARSRWMWTAIVFEIALIACFKYSDVLFPRVEDALRGVGLPVAEGALRPLLPIGLSFYALARLSHTLDVCFGRIDPSRNFVDFATFVSFFPVLTSGPIERARNILPQLEKTRSFDYEDLQRGLWLVFVGVFKKVFVADHCAAIAHDLLEVGGGETVTATFVGIYAYAFELYADFAGYTDMARGSARLFGVRVLENFAAPYASPNLAEFWRRWHISLSTFFDEYLYKPASFALRDHGLVGVAAALFVTFLTSGIWHGRGWTFVVWGAIHAFGLTVVAATASMRRTLSARFPGWPLRALATLVTFHFVCLGWVFFRAPSVGAAIDLLSNLGHARVGFVSASDDLLRLLRYAGAIVLLDVFMRRGGSSEWVFGRPAWFRTLVYAVMLLCVVRFYAPAFPFVYVQFG